MSPPVCSVTMLPIRGDRCELDAVCPDQRGDRAGSHLKVRWVGLQMGDHDVSLAPWISARWMKWAVPLSIFAVHSSTMARVPRRPTYDARADALPTSPDDHARAAASFSALAARALASAALRRASPSGSVIGRALPPRLGLEQCERRNAAAAPATRAAAGEAAER